MEYISDDVVNAVFSYDIETILKKWINSGSGLKELPFSEMKSTIQLKL